MKTRISPQPSRLPLLILPGLGDVVRPSVGSTTGATAFSFKINRLPSLPRSERLQENGLRGREHVPDAADPGAARRRLVLFPR